MQVEWVLLVVAEHLEHDGLGLDVLDERLGDFHRNLLFGQRNDNINRDYITLGPQINNTGSESV